MICKLHKKVEPLLHKDVMFVYIEYLKESTEQLPEVKSKVIKASEFKINYRKLSVFLQIFRILKF